MLINKKVNIERYIGIPFVRDEATFNGCDCYGIVRLYYKHQLSIDVPDPKQTEFDSKGIFDSYIREIAKDWKSVSEPQLHDVIAIADDTKMPDIVQHFGIYLGNGKMLHTKGKMGTHITSVKSYKYFIKGYHRWQH